ncbi:MAG: glycosyltransferase [Acidobacteria bacterium]|nr:glycosyltransferase [Acidobacteriota bacterium]
MRASVCLIVPCFNEAGRLDFDRFDDAPAGVTCLLVDDGSSDGTGALARHHESATFRVLELPVNVGKGEAVRRGVLHARDSGLLEQADWFGYWDADLSTPLSEVERFLAYAAFADGPVDGILGSRVRRLGSTIVRSSRRHLLGRVFATLAEALLRLECYDSQCGAKLFRSSLAVQAFGEPFISRWIFDVEILLRLRSQRLIEYPLGQWIDVGGGTLRPWAVVVPTLIDLLRIRRRYAPRRQA